MKSILVIATVIAVAVAVVTADPAAEPFSYTEADRAMWTRFEAFQVKHSKVYELGVEQKTAKFATFKSNMLKADEWTAMHNGTAKFGETPFADLTADEFVSQVLMRNYKPQAHLARDVSATLPPIAESDDTPMEVLELVGDASTPNPTARLKAGVAAGAAPTSYDWNAQGMVSPVRDQQSCGCCWAFAALGEVESLLLIKTQGKFGLQLSPQQLVDCDTTDFGCDGGNAKSAFQYIYSNLVMPDFLYPYTGVQGKCGWNVGNAQQVLTSGDSTTPGTTVSAIASYIYTHGPTTAALDATQLQLYQSGIMNFPPSLCPTMNHIVVLTGYNIKQKYFIAKNSYGPKWGENGFFRISAQSCMINTEVIGSADAA